MLKFLHISDLHITTTDEGTQFDLCAKIRAAMLEDIRGMQTKNFAGIFVTGDIAYHGLATEFARAKAWIEELRVAAGAPPEAVFVVPGNHDVNRATVSKNSSLWELHQALRKLQNDEERNDSLNKKLQDPFDFLTSLTEYRAFASDFSCPTTPAALTWMTVLDPKVTLEDGRTVRVHGLNTALLSDGEDICANLLLSPTQFHHFSADAGYINIVLLHHPPRWLIDGNKADDYLRERSQVVLSGHDHDNRCYTQGNSVRVFAGALHPNPREMDWKPCYHVLTLSVETNAKPELVVRVETRTWQAKQLCFGVEIHKESPYYEARLELKPWNSPPASPLKPVLAAMPATTAAPAMTENKITNADVLLAARRKLIVHFFRLGTVDRYQSVINAGIWEEGDDAYSGQEKWARVFERADKQSRLQQLWDAVAARDAELKRQPNPFTP